MKKWAKKKSSRRLPSDIILDFARVRLNREREKGMYLFPEGIHREVLLEAIIDYLDSVCY